MRTTPSPAPSPVPGPRLDTSAGPFTGRGGSLPAVALAVLAGAMLGAVASDGWRLGIPAVTALGSLHAPWAVLPFAVGWRAGRGRATRGAGLGAATGFAAIAGYYTWQAAAHSLHAATSQLTETGGAFWVTGATLGGAVFGALGAVGSPGSRAGRPLAGAAVLVTAAVPLAELGLVAWFRRQDLAPDHSGATLVVAAGLATVLVGVAWWRAPAADFARAMGLACLPALLGLALALGAEARFAYLTL